MSGRGTHVFATRKDLLPVLAAIEARRSVKYIPMRHFPSPTFETYTRGEDLPGLGIATHESATVGTAYLVADPPTPILPREIRPTSLPVRFALDQMLNPDTIVFWPGGLWGDNCLLHGRVATISDSGPAQSLLRLFGGAFRKRFVHVRAFWVGPEALTMLRAGKRLTPAEQCPREYDLQEEQP